VPRNESRSFATRWAVKTHNGEEGEGLCLLPGGISGEEEARDVDVALLHRAHQGREPIHVPAIGPCAVLFEQKLGRLNVPLREQNPRRQNIERERERKVTCK
jgi:hypothetical protein